MCLWSLTFTGVQFLLDVTSTVDGPARVDAAAVGGDEYCCELSAVDCPAVGVDAAAVGICGVCGC